MAHKKQYPRKAKFFLADIIHIDSNNSKPTLIGFFPGDTVGLNMQKGASEPSDSEPVVIQALSILTAFVDCRGTFDANISLFRPDGKPMFEDKKISTIGTGENPVIMDINFVVQFQPFNVPQIGTYRFVVRLDKKKYEYEFKFQRGIENTNN